jgi:hypothetical protein
MVKKVKPQKSKFNNETYNMHFKYRGKKVLETFFISNEEETLETVNEEVKKYQELAKKHNKEFDLIVSLKFNSGWRSGKLFSLDEEPKYYKFHADHSGENADELGLNIDNNAKFKQFAIFSIPKAPNKGGCVKNSNKNDCLFYAICKSLSSIKEDVNTPIKFKNKLNLERNDKISISQIPQIEDLINVNINVIGDYTYNSKNKHLRTIKIKLENGHYDVEKIKKNTKNNKLIPNKKEIVFYKIVNDEIKMCFKNLQVKTIKLHEFQNFKLENGYYYVKLKSSKFTLEEYTQMFYQSSEKLTKLTRTVINIKDYPQPSRMAQYLYNYFTLDIPDAEPLTQIEQQIIYKSFMGGLIFSNEGYFENCISYDMNSNYLYFMSNKYFTIPFKQGEMQYLVKLNEYVEYGIYHCVIKNETNNKHLNKLFSFNNDNWYSHFDIKNAKMLNFTIEMIQDNESNCIIYIRETRLTGEQVFGKYRNFIYQLKKESPFIKSIISSSWGWHCEKNFKKFKSIYKLNEIDEIPNNMFIETIEKNDNGLKAKCFPKDDMYKYSTARLGVFLTSYNRFMMSKFIIDNKIPLDNIHKINTDGFVVQNFEIDDEFLSDELGAWKIEDMGNVIIKNAFNAVFD